MKRCIAFALLMILCLCGEWLVETTVGVVTIFAVIGAAQLLIGTAGKEKMKGRKNHEMD